MSARRRREVLEEVSDKLVDQGFDARETENVLDNLVEKYRNGWGFRRKIHLARKGQNDSGDESED